MLTLALIFLQAAAAYLIVFGMLRVLGKRHVGQFAPSDLIVLLLIGDALQGAMLGGDQSFAGGIAAVGGVLLASRLLDWLAYRLPRLEPLIEGEPVILFENGELNRRRLDHENISMNDLEAAMREHGYAHLAEVDRITLEANGRMSVIGAFRSNRPKEAALG